MGTNNVIPRACQNCRVRKIRCNRELPCSNCITSNITCLAIGQPVARRTTPGTPPAAASQSNQLGGLHDRLARLEQTLERVLDQNSRHEPATAAAAAAPRVQTSHSVVPANTTVPLEGETSFDRQVYWASQISELTSPEAASSSAIVDELKTLQKVIQEQKLHVGDAPPGPRRNPNQLQMDLVPSDFALRVFRLLKDNQSLVFLFQPVYDLAQLESLCQRIYFPTSPLSTGELTVFHGILFFAMWEFQPPTLGISAEDVERYGDLCWANFQAGLETHEVVAIPTYENALALAMAAIDAQVKGRRMLQWNFVSAAARHCLALGYHRADTSSSLPHREGETLRRLFWWVFMSDSTLSLSLGRAPTIHEYDVDTPPVAVPKDTRRAPWDQCLMVLSRFGVLLSSIYRELYSPKARRLDGATRQRIVADLAAKTKQWYADWQTVDGTKAYHAQIFKATFSGVEVTYYSTLTLLYRGATLSNAISDISRECFAAARQGLEAHLKSFDQVVSMGSNAVSMYADWILLFASFTPYVVTFLHCIGHADPADLGLLRRVNDSIEQMAMAMEACRRQHELCKSLLRVAEAFLESRLKSGGQHGDTGMPPQQEQQQQQQQFDRTLHLSLQNPLINDCDWTYLQTTLDGWTGQPLGAPSFTLGSRIDSHLP